jgi:predicted nucleic acid-binding protein
MSYLLDTNTVSDLYEINSLGYTSIVRRLGEISGSVAIFVSVLTLYELEYGYANAPADMRPTIRQRIESVQTDFVILDLSPRAAQVFGTLKKKLRDSRKLTEKGSRYHNVDLMIAATAVVEPCILVSSDSIFRDLRDLEPDLKHEVWNGA